MPVNVACSRIYVCTFYTVVRGVASGGGAGAIALTVHFGLWENCRKSFVQKMQTLVPKTPPFWRAELKF